MSKPFKDTSNEWLEDIQKEMKDAGVIGNKDNISSVTPKNQFIRKDLADFFKAVENLKKLNANSFKF